jgi:hypothetical protein
LQQMNGTAERQQGQNGIGDGGGSLRRPVNKLDALAPL